MTSTGLPMSKRMDDPQPLPTTAHPTTDQLSQNEEAVH